MKKVLRVFLISLGLIVSLVLLDGFSARYLKTRPLIAKKENVKSGIMDSGVVYKSLFADIYYCNTILNKYDEDNNRVREEIVMRYYKKKGEDFICPVLIDERDEIYTNYFDETVEYSDFDYMKNYAEGLYKSKLVDNGYGYNKKLGVYIVNFNGHSKISEELQDVYMFSVSDFSKDPIKLTIPGFDLQWRAYQIYSSPEGEILAFQYSCGYKEMWSGEQKYSKEDCLLNEKEDGIYVFKVNGINDYEQIEYLSDYENEYLEEYPDTYFYIDKITSEKEIVIKYIVSKNKQEEPIMEVKKIWNIEDGTLKDYQG